MIAGADTQRLWHRGNQILFITIAGHKGVGFTVSNVELPPATRRFEQLTAGYEVSAEQLIALQALLEQRGIDYTGPVSHPSGFPLLRSLYFQDPDGYTVEACVRASGGVDPSPPEASAVGPRRISHVRVEVSDVGRASRWYQEILGLQPLAERDGEAYLQVQAGDQLLVLRPTTALSPRRDFVRGPHIDFETPPEAYPAVLGRIPQREGYWDGAPHPFPGPREVNNDVTVYFCDADGNRCQVSPAGSH
jgi:catechol 2,3-dioxygenase-like lactoylglutathione lyase family enzyme